MLQILQATILVSLYELQQADFSGAWLSASRAVWLTEELQLHWLDSDNAPSSVLEKDLQSARRAFWAASILASCIFMLHRNIGMTSEDTDSVREPDSPL